MENNEIKVNKERLAEICLRAHQAYNQKNGVFKEGIKKYLPQWNLPQELEYDPQRKEVKDPKQAANYLWVMALLERRSLSRINIRNGLATWKDKDVRWIFDPLQASSRNIQDLKNVFSYNIQYTLNDFAESYQKNSIKLVVEYEGDSRNIINGKSVEQAKKELMDFKGIGTGISNLFMIYLSDRELASLTDMENRSIKVDVHKSRLSLNTNCINVKGGEIRRDKLVKILEKEYREIYQQRGLDPLIIDSILWIICSELCARKDYNVCTAICPLEDLCLSHIPENKDTAKFKLFRAGPNQTLIRIDSRKNLGQTYFPFHRET